LIFLKRIFLLLLLGVILLDGFSKSFIHQHIIADLAVGISLGLISISDRFSLSIHLWMNISNGE
tara:strand:+ start:1820 stop:2011 length:192 start_codon:yes stop_codon:yes gene_type:complete